VRDRPRRGAGSVEELAGFLAGLSSSLDAERRAGHPRPGLEAELARARGALERGDRSGASDRLERIASTLGEERKESELVDRPRGLVGYVPVGERGSAVGDADDPLANRRRLVLRLADLVELDPVARGRLLEELRTAEAELARGDRGAARARIDAAHRHVEQAAARRR
jgi:hypothetical protein